MLKLCLGYVSIFDIYLHNLSSILLLIFNFIEFLVHFLANSVVDPEVGEVHGTVVELEASASIDDEDCVGSRVLKKGPPRAFSWLKGHTSTLT